jgi:peroxiredoxin
MATRSLVRAVRGLCYALAPVTTTAAHPLAAPEFELPDHMGRTFRLDARRGIGPTVIVFYRGHWCPYCRRYLAKLQSQLDAVRQLGADVVAISPEPPATSAMLARELAIGFPLLSDRRGEVIDRYGARNSFTSATTVLPHAAVVIVDAHGFVRFKSVDRNYKKRTTIRAILNVLREVEPQMNADERR